MAQYIRDGVIYAEHGGSELLNSKDFLFTPDVEVADITATNVNDAILQLGSVARDNINALDSKSELIVKNKLINGSVYIDDSITMSAYTSFDILVVNSSNELLTSTHVPVGVLLRGAPVLTTYIGDVDFECGVKYINGKKIDIITSMEKEDIFIELWGYKTAIDSVKPSSINKLLKEVNSIKYNSQTIYLAVVKDDWVYMGNEYVNTIQINGITEEDIPIYGLYGAKTNAEIAAYSKLTSLEACNGYIKLTSKDLIETTFAIIVRGLNIQSAGDINVVNFDSMMSSITNLEQKINNHESMIFDLIEKINALTIKVNEI